jgi:ATP-dependent helicase HrpB
LNPAAARQVQPLCRQFLDIAKGEGLDTSSRAAAPEALRKAILTAFSDRVARRLERGNSRCELVHGRRGSLARDSVVRDSLFFVAAEVQEVEGRDKSVNTVLSQATAIDEQWLELLFPEDIERTQRAFYEAASRRVYSEEQLSFRGLRIAAQKSERVPADDAARLLTEEICAGRLALEAWDDSVEQWIIRLNLLSQWCPDLALPPITESDRRDLIEQVCHGAFSAKDLRDKPVKAIVAGWLNAAQQALVEKHAPERLTLPNGRTPKVHYETKGSPFIAVRIQELYDVNATPRIAMGRVPVVLHILAPSMRPVQVTTDLPGFWREHYPKIKQELQRKYPKHKWR